MGSIYRHASCNIAATWAADGSDGCFSARDPALLGPTTIMLPIQHHQSQVYHLAPYMGYYDDVVNAQLNQRGWVVQERHMARRQLNFTAHQVYWECEELVASELFPSGIPRHLTNFSPYNRDGPPSAKPSLYYNDERLLRHAWVALVDLYSDCKLTFPTDKLVAIAGLARALREATKDDYIAGMRKKELCKQLCWSTEFDVRYTADRFAASTYIAPTWSWAHMNGPVMSDARYFDPSWEIISCAQVLDVRSHAGDPLKLHSFSSASLVLQGFAVSATVIPSRGSHIPDHCKHHILLSNPTTDISEAPVMEIQWDESLSCAAIDPGRWKTLQDERRSTLLFVILYIDAFRFAWDIVLRRVAGSPDEDLYVRMGTFCEFNALSAWIARKLGQHSIDAVVEVVHLDHPDLADLVHTVTII